MTKISGLPVAADPLPAGSETVVSVPVGGGEYESRSYDMSLTAQYAAAAEAAAASVAALAVGTTPMFKLYSLLLPVEGEDVGQNAGVYGEDISATHTDPVSSLTVSNNGRYSWSGTDWEWVSTLLTNEVITGGTVTTATPVLTLAQTWNNSDVNLKAVEVNITNAASFRQSTFYRATMGGVTRFSVTRDDSLMFGDIDGHTDDGDAAIGIRRMTGRVLGFCSQRSFDDGLPEAVMTTYWENSANGGYADKTVATLRGHGTNRFSIESDAALIHIAENGRFEWEVGFTSSDDRVKFIAYQKASSEGRSFDFRNYGQSVYADSVVCISSDTDAVDLLRFEKYAGSAWTTRAKIDAFGKVHTPAVVDGGTIVRAPGTSLTGTTAETTLATITLPANSMGPNGQIELETYFSCPANVNTKTLRVKFGGTTIFTSPAIGSTNTGHQAHIRTANKTAGTQVSFPTIGPGHGASTAAPVTSSVDTTSNVTILITGQLGDAGDTMILESYYVVTHYGA